MENNGKRWVPTSEILELQGEVDHLLQRRGLSEWQAITVCTNLISTIICHTWHDEKRSDQRELAVKSVVDNLRNMVEKAPWIDDTVEPKDWEVMDPKKAKNYKVQWSPTLSTHDVDEVMGPIIGHGIKLTKDCEALNNKGCVTWMPMLARDRKWAVVLLWIRDAKPWDLIVVESDEKAKQVCHMIGVDNVPPNKLWKQPANNLRATNKNLNA